MPTAVREGGREARCIWIGAEPAHATADDVGLVGGRGGFAAEEDVTQDLTGGEAARPGRRPTWRAAMRAGRGRETLRAKPPLGMPTDVAKG